MRSRPRGAAMRPRSGILCVPPPRGRRLYCGQRHRELRCAAPSLKSRPLLCLTVCRRPYGRHLKVDLDGKSAAVCTRARRMRISMDPCRPNAPLRARVALRTVEQCAIVRLPDAAMQADGTVCVRAGGYSPPWRFLPPQFRADGPTSTTTTAHALSAAFRPAVGAFFARCPSARRAPPADEKLLPARANCSCLQSLQQMRVVPPYWAHSKVPTVLLLRAQPNFMTGSLFL